jgi:hypothetical protein
MEGSRGEKFLRIQMGGQAEDLLPVEVSTLKRGVRSASSTIFREVIANNPLSSR